MNQLSIWDVPQITEYGDSIDSQLMKDHIIVDASVQAR